MSKRIGGQKLARSADAIIMAAVNAARAETVSVTFFFNVCRTQATTCTAVYFDSRAQDRSMTIDSKVNGHVLIAEAR